MAHVVVIETHGSNYSGNYIWRWNEKCVYFAFMGRTFNKNLEDLSILLVVTLLRIKSFTIELRTYLNNFLPVNCMAAGSPAVGHPPLILELIIVYGIQGLKCWGWVGCGLWWRLCCVMKSYNTRIWSLYVIW